MKDWKGGQHGYGVLSFEDVAFLEKHLATIAKEFSMRVSLLEIGTASGYTGKGISRFCGSIGAKLKYQCIDGVCGRPHPGNLPDGGIFHCGDSRELFESINGSFNLIFIDACHCNNCCILDFLNYSPKCVVGGYVLFHDTNPSPKWQGAHWQGHGPKTPAFCLGVRMALDKLGLLHGKRTDWSFVDEQKAGEGFGMMLFRKTA